ncbi:TonB-dependent receptor plug domain-containing protein [Lysobacter silvisoli]|uniref:TonB-dependent receptor n=1 Tax=Lysobacter silvisoli TaxID=2293254 RepID=A0A371K4R1_9GAMM|nr:TonB-dependent receptor [Lysobacter silvisoli]RDZ28850.1 TonB-dependent receptor [Lysobacter silvisoli]
MEAIEKRLPRSRLTAALLAVLIAPAAGGAFAQDSAAAQPAPANDQATDVEGVTVVGSRIKRAQIEGPAPVTVISREDIDKQGFQTVSDMLSSLTQNTTNSFTGDLAVNGFTPNAQVVNLRNLGPGYTLVLVNGRRISDYPQPYNSDRSSVNVGAIPSSIIERVEVLSGGASAIYGSDAVAGVVNIVTRTNFEGNLLRGTVGTTSGGGGDSLDLEYSGGRVGDNWSLTYALQYNYDEPIFASQRDFMDDLRDGPRGNQVGPSLSLVAIDLLNRGRAAYYPGQEVCDRFGFTPYLSATRGQICGSYDSVASQSISNKRENMSAYAYGTYDFSNGLQAWASTTLYDSKAESSSGTEFWGTAGDPFLPASFYFDSGLGTFVQLQRVLTPKEVGGNTAVTTKYDEKAYDFSTGLRGTFADRFDWDLTGTYGRYEYKSDSPRLLAKSVHDYFLGDLEGIDDYGYAYYTLNLDRWHTPLTPAQYRAMSTRVINKGHTTSGQASFTVSGDLFDMPAGPVGFAGTLEFGRQTLQLNSDPRTDPNRTPDETTPYNLVSSGDIKGERDRYAIGAEFRVPLLSNLNAQIAGRYDKYDDITEVDGAFTYGLGLEYRPIERLLLRANYSTSFRAPDMPLVFAQGVASFAGVLDYYGCRAGGETVTDCNASGHPMQYQSQNQTVGNPGLKEEEGKSLTAGFVLDLIEGMSMSIDYYKIQLDDQATALSLDYILQNEANCRLGTYANGTPFPNAPTSAFCQDITSRVTRQQAPGQANGRVVNIRGGYINAARSINTGIDATWRYRFDTDRWGNFDFNLAYSLSLGEKYKQFEEDDLIDYRDRLDNDNQRSRVRGSVTWEKGDWTTTVFGQRLGSAPNAAEAAGRDSVTGRYYGARLQPYMLYNLAVEKKFGENFEAAFIVNNVLDNTHRKDLSDTGYPFFNPFIGADPFGRAYHLRLSYKF